MDARVCGLQVQKDPFHFLSTVQDPSKLTSERGTKTGAKSMLTNITAAAVKKIKRVGEQVGH